MPDKENRQRTLSRVLLVAAAALVLAWAGAVALWGRAAMAKPVGAVGPTDGIALGRAQAVVTALGLCGADAPEPREVWSPANAAERRGAFVLADGWYRYLFRADGTMISVALQNVHTGSGAELPIVTGEADRQALLERIVTAARSGSKAEDLTYDYEVGRNDRLVFLCSLHVGEVAYCANVEPTEGTDQVMGVSGHHDFALTGEGYAAWDREGRLSLVELGGSFTNRAEQPALSQRQAIAAALAGVAEHHDDMDTAAFPIDRADAEVSFGAGGYLWDVTLNDVPYVSKEDKDIGVTWWVVVDGYSGAILYIDHCL